MSGNEMEYFNYLGILLLQIIQHLKLDQDEMYIFNCFELS
jgi:hypothetical protein